MVRQSTSSASKLKKFVWREGMHPWHEIPIGVSAPEEVNAYIGKPGNGVVSDELISNFQRLHREYAVLPPLSYPAKYGFIPQTLEKSGHPLDGLILMQRISIIQPVILVRPIGLVRLKGTPYSHNLICVHVEDPFYSPYRCVTKLPVYERRRLKWFFNDYQNLMEREVNVDSFQRAAVAKDYVRYCQALYQEKCQPDEGQTS